MVVRTEMRVTEIRCGLGERDQVVERARLARERDQRKMDAELHLNPRAPDSSYCRQDEHAVR
jgi:hypothetical protein